MAIPESIKDVTPVWLSNVLGKEVLNCKTHYLEGGVVGDAFKVHDIEYAGTPGPASAVVKLANVIPEKREYAMENHIYVKEVNFYKHFGQDLPLRCPEVYHLESDDENNCEFFVILMEDLTAHSLVFDQVDDPPCEKFIPKINEQVAAFHARFWQSEELELDWLKLPESGYEFPMTPACRACPETFETFVPLWVQMFGSNPFKEERWQTINRLCELVVTGPKSGALLDYMNHKLDQRPKTLVHGDIRADNIFRTHPERGLSAEESTLTYIDWQMLQPGPPGPEFTQSWQHSLPPEMRRNDLTWLKTYHDRLLTLAPDAAVYSYEDLIEDYKIGFILWWMALVTLGSTTIPIFDKPEGQRMRALWSQGLGYSWQAMIDHNCLDMVEQFAAEV